MTVEQFTIESLTNYLSGILPTVLRDNITMSAFPKQRSVELQYSKEFTEVVDPIRPNISTWLQTKPTMEGRLAHEELTWFVPMYKKTINVDADQQHFYESHNISWMEMAVKQITHFLYRELDICSFYKDASTYFNAKTLLGLGELSAGATRITYNDPGASVSAAGTSIKSAGIGVVTDFMSVLAEFEEDGLPAPKSLTMIASPNTFIWLNGLQATYNTFSGLGKVREIARDMGITIRGPYPTPYLGLAPTAATSTLGERLGTSETDTTGHLAYIHDAVFDGEVKVFRPLQIKAWADPGTDPTYHIEGSLSARLTWANAQGLCLYDDVKWS